MGLNPLIAARSYTFHVFFILPEELEINILFLIHRLCVFVFVFLFICPENITVKYYILLFGRPAAKMRLPDGAAFSAKPQANRGQ